MNRLAALAAVLFLWVMPAIAGDLPRPLTDDDFRTYPEAQVKLGQLLFYDRILSGTYRVSCATCHNHDRASSNGARLDGKEEERDDLAVGGEPVYEPFRPSSKHAPTLFNLGAKQFTRMFADGRVERLPDGSFRSPAGADLPKGLNDVLAVQALFPAVQGDELVGTVENDLTAVAHKGNAAIWNALAARVRDTAEYWPHFEAAYPELKRPKNITIVEIANAIGAFVGTEWRSDDAPFDRYLHGDEDALTAQQKLGMDLFYGTAKCDTCHSGALHTDHQFGRVLAESTVSELHEFAEPDRRHGRSAVTGDSRDFLRFKIPSLRNVVHTPPFGRLGNYESIDDVIRSHTRVVNYRFRTRRKSSDGLESVLDFSGRTSSDMPEIGYITDREIADLVAFLESLTDEKGLHGKLGKPAEVPSSLALD